MTPTPVGGWLHRRNPTVKLVLVFVVSFANLFLFDLRVLGLLYAAAVVGVLACRAVSLRTLLLGHLPFLVFGIGLVAVNWMTRPENGLAIGAALALRGLVIGVLSIAFIATTPPRDLMVSLVQHARLSPRFAYPLLAGHRMLQTMPARWGTIRAAQAVRAPRGRNGRVRFGAKEFGQAAFALLVGSIRASEQIALALESRGLRAGPRTIHRPVPLTASDWVLAVVVVCTFTALVALPGALS